MQSLLSQPSKHLFSAAARKCKYLRMLNNAFKLVPLSIRERVYERQISPVITWDWEVYKKLAEDMVKEDPEYDAAAVSMVTGLIIGNTLSRIIGKYAATVLRDDKQGMAKLERRLDTYFSYITAMYHNGEKIYFDKFNNNAEINKDEFMKVVTNSLESNIKLGLGFSEKEQETLNPFEAAMAVLADELVPAKTLLDMNKRCIAISKRILGKLFKYADRLDGDKAHLRGSVIGIWNALMSAMHENYPEHFVKDKASVAAF